MKVIGMLRVRNEQNVLPYTLEHMAKFCDGVVIYDDCSTDATPEIIRSHPLVIDCILSNHWDRNRGRAEHQNRQAVLNLTRKHADPNDWLIYQDADEFIEFDWTLLKDMDSSVAAVRMKLFDFYITKEDVLKHFLQREFMGPEYREIIMLFRNHPNLRYKNFDQRQVHLNQPGAKIMDSGYVRHYGKAISVEEWEATCRYYGTKFPKYSKKWTARMGKAIHNRSSFDRWLIKWHEKDKLGIKMTPSDENRSIY